MENNKDQQKELLQSFQKVMEKSIEANTKIMKATTDTFSKMLSKKADWNDLQRLNSEVLNSTVSNYMEIYLQYAENLINLGVQLSDDISSFVETLDKKNTSEEKASPAPKEQAVRSTPQKSEIRLSGQNGETIVTSFTLNNSAEAEQKGKFKASRCTSEQTGKGTNIRIKFNPESFHIPPGDKVEIEISASIPKSTQAGTYRSQVKIIGFHDTQFDVVIFIEEKAKVK